MDSFITLICHNITSNIFYSMVAAIIRPRPQHRDDRRLAARFRLEKEGGHHAPPKFNVGAAAPMIAGQRCGFRQPFHLEVAPITW